MSAANTIALLLPVKLEYSARLSEGAAEYLVQHADMHLVELPYVCAGKSPLPAGDLSFAGVVFWASPEDLWVPDLVHRVKNVVSCGSDWQTQGIAAVTIEAEEVCSEAIEHLAGLQPKCLAVAAHDTSNRPELVKRNRLFASRAEQLGLPFREFEIQGEDPALSSERRIGDTPEPELANFLNSLPKPAGIWCEMDHTAVFVCRVARQLGIAVPEELTVLGLGDYVVGRFNNPPISSIPQPGRLVGYEGTKLLHCMMRGAPKPTKAVHIPCPSVVERESTVRAVSQDIDVRRAYELIHERAAQGITVDNLVQLTTVSKKTLTDHFKRAYGSTPGQEIRRVRLAYAKKLLEKTDLTVTRIADFCGFESIRCFNVFFKRETGVPPTEHRKRVRG